MFFRFPSEMHVVHSLKDESSDDEIVDNIAVVGYMLDVSILLHQANHFLYNQLIFFKNLKGCYFNLFILIDSTR